ncbi:MAG TPA: L-histidine N(alpha)-methyltransferase, partial [Allocoleopsis sp.]
MIYQLHDFHPEIGNFREEIIAGLSLKQKAIAPKFFYDQKGSELFAQICDLPEYYPTRTEISILNTYSEEISQLIDENCLFIEYGSGNSQKIRILLDILQKPAGYMPIDISKEYMLQACEELGIIYPELNIIPVCADYTKDLKLPLIEQDINKKVIFFPGSTIGNLTPEEALELMQKSATLLNNEDGFLIGVDLKKDSDILNAAYNDLQGVTAQFNLNLLQ